MVLHDSVQGIAKCRSCSHRFDAEEYALYLEAIAPVEVAEPDEPDVDADLETAALDEETARIPKSMTDVADDESEADSDE